MEAWQHWHKARDAREFFRSVPRTVSEMERWRVVADEGVDALALPVSHGGGSGVSDPTANRAIWLADHDDSVRAEAIKKVRQCEERIGAALIVIEYVRTYLGEKYADSLELHYVDCLSISATAHELQAGRTTVKGRICVACDWLDSLPTSTIFGFRPPMV